MPPSTLILDVEKQSSDRLYVPSCSFGVDKFMKQDQLGKSILAYLDRKEFPYAELSLKQTSVKLTCLQPATDPILISNILALTINWGLSCSRIIQPVVFFIAPNQVLETMKIVESSKLLTSHPDFLRDENTGLYQKQNLSKPFVVFTPATAYGRRSSFLVKTKNAPDLPYELLTVFEDSWLMSICENLAIFVATEGESLLPEKIPQRP